MKQINKKKGKLIADLENLMNRYDELRQRNRILKKDEEQRNSKNELKILRKQKSIYTDIINEIID